MSEGGQGTLQQQWAYMTPTQRFFALMRRRFKMACEAENMSRLEQQDDARFYASIQWNPQDIAKRIDESRPTATINRLPQFVSQVTNQMRASRPGITIVPKDHLANKHTAEILQDWIRTIEYESNAQSAYDTAGDLMAQIGLGYIRVSTEFDDTADEDSFEQKPVIERQRDRFQVYVDPNYQKFDGSDMRFAFIVEDMPREEYEARYGQRVYEKDNDAAGASVSSMAGSADDYQGVGDDKPYWTVPGGGIRVVHYWYVDETFEEVVVVDIPDGVPNEDGATTAYKRDILPASSIDLSKWKAAGVREITRRRKPTRVVRWCTCNAVRILEGGSPDGSEGSRWGGKTIPIIPFVGNEMVVDGKVDRRGMIRNAKDSQRSYNVWINAATEMVALAPRSPWVMAEGQDEGYEEMWNQANVANFARLIYKPVALGDQLAPPPQRQALEPPIQAIIALVRQADNDLKATMGFYDASLGSEGPESSGKAILARQKQGEIGNAQYLQNYAAGVKRVGQVLLELVPVLMDVPKVLKLTKADGEVEYVQHYPGEVPAGFQPPENVREIVDITRGVYDCVVTIGPSYLTRRQEAVAQLGELMKSAPSLAAAVADIWVSSMDAPWATEAAERLKRMVPPQILGDEGEDGKPPVPPQVQQQMQQMAAQMQQMGMALQQLQAKLQEAEQRVKDKSMDAQVRLQIEQLKAAAAEQVEAMRVEADERIARMNAEMKIAIEQAKIEAKTAIAAAKPLRMRGQKPPVMGR